MVGQHRLKKVAADSWHQPAVFEIYQTNSDAGETAHSSNSLSARETNTNGSQVNPTVSGTTISELNDDCLIEIFNNLSIVDLCAVGATCIRFNQITQAVFARDHRSIDFGQAKQEKHKSSKLICDRLTLHETRNLLLHFGHVINQIHVDSSAFKTKNLHRIFDLIVRHCPNLNVLSINDVYLKNSTIMRCRTLFNGLSELKTRECHMRNGHKQIFKNCGNLSKLEVKSEYSMDGSSLRMSFENLRSASLISICCITADDLYRFIELNTKLKNLVIINCAYIYDEIFEKIGVLLPELESLSISIDDFTNLAQNLNHLLSLNSLKELKLNCSLYSIATFVHKLAEKGVIEVLHISGGVLDEHLVDALCACKSLKSLKLGSMPSMHDRFLKKLAENLPNLTEFHLTECQTMTVDGIVKFVDKAAKLKTLNIVNSTIAINEYLYMSLVEILRSRNHTLTLNYSRCMALLPAETRNQFKNYVTVAQLSTLLSDEDEYFYRGSDDDDDDDDYDFYDYDSDVFLFDSDEDNYNDFDDFHEYEDYAYYAEEFFLN